MNVVPRDLMTEIPVSSADFRGAMRHLTGGVSVITAGRGKDITGMTVTSVSSFSVDPPTLIVSINRDASSFPLIRRHGAFGVNILAADQLDIAERFAGKGGLKGADRFAGARWVTAVSGVPLLVGALSAVDCEVESSSSAIRTASSSDGCETSGIRPATLRWPIGTASTWRWIRTKTRSGFWTFAFPRKCR